MQFYQKNILNLISFNQKRYIYLFTFGIVNIFYKLMSEFFHYNPSLVEVIFYFSSCKSVFSVCFCLNERFSCCRFTAVAESLQQVRQHLNKMLELEQKFTYENDPISQKKSHLENRALDLLKNLLSRYDRDPSAGAAAAAGPTWRLLVFAALWW